MVEHTGHLDHPLELQFAPATPRLRRSQRLHQVGGLGLQLTLRLRQRPHLLGQRGIGIDARLLDAGDLLLELLERALHRRHQLAKRLLALLQLTAGNFLLSLERQLGQFQETLVVALQRIRGQGLERLDHIDTLGIGLAPALAQQPIDHRATDGRTGGKDEQQLHI